MDIVMHSAKVSRGSRSSSAINAKCVLGITNEV
jgi:hypothetical protein